MADIWRGTQETRSYDRRILRASDSVVFHGDTQHTYVSSLDAPAVLIMTNSVPFQG